MRFDNVLPWFYGPVHSNAISTPRGVYSAQYCSLLDGLMISIKNNGRKMLFASIICTCLKTLHSET